MATMREAVIVEAVRTAVGRKNGRLKDWHPVDLMAQVLSALVQRTGVDTNLVEDVIIGCVSQVGEQSLNVGRNAALAAGFPETVPGTNPRSGAVVRRPGRPAGATAAHRKAGVSVGPQAARRRQKRIPATHAGARLLKKTAVL